MTHSVSHGLELGALDFVSAMTYNGGFTLRILGADATFGASQAVVREIVSMLADGNHVKYDRAGNRTASFNVQIEGPDGPALAAGEKALRRELYRPNLLTWTPPNFLSEPTVFEVITSEMTPLFDHVDELRDRRRFRVTLTCSPFARSKDPVTVAALPAGGATVTATITNADTTTGWSVTVPTLTGFGPGTVTDGGDYVTVTNAGPGSAYANLTYVPASSVNMATTRYLLIEATADIGSARLEFYVKLNGGSAWITILPTVARLQSNGRVSYALDTGGAVLDQISIAAGRKDASPLTISVFDVTRSSALPQVSPRQITRTIKVGGTERTPGSVHVSTASGTGSLGQAIVHTCPEDGSGYSPPLQRWRTVGQTRTTDATAFSGTYESINVTSWVAEVPTSALPEGGYSLVARLRAQTAATVLVSYSTSTIFPGGTVQQGFTLGRYSHTFAVANEWDIVPLAVLSLPSVRTKAGKVQIALQVEAASPVVTLDEAWLFREEDDCALSIVKTARPHLWLNSADVDSPVPTVWVGDGASTLVHPGEGLVAQGTHVLSSDGTAVFTAALTDNPATDATFHIRNHSNM